MADKKTLVLIADLAPLCEEALFGRLYEKMPEDRRKKIDTLRTESGRRQSLGAGVLLQEACRRFHLEGADRSILLQRQGKPAFVSFPKIHFNLSHSGERAMCVMSHREAGCDVERVQVLRWPVARRVFSASELDWLVRQEATGKGPEAFSRLWTRKESVLKALGSGFAEENIAHIGVPEDAGFFEPDLADGYCYACCLLGAKADRPPELSVCDLRSL